MKHKLKISVSKQPQTGGIVTCRSTGGITEEAGKG